MKALGLDLSLTGTGVAHPDGSTHTVRVPTLTGMTRLGVIRHDILELAEGADVVAIEGYSMGTARQASHAHGLGELGGVIRLALYDAGIPYVDIPPASAKKYATGKGNANKNDMLLAAVKRLGYGGNSNDEADALWLRMMALDHYANVWDRHPNGVVDVPVLNREALAKVQWPDLAVRPAA